MRIIGGKYKGAKLASPTSKETRPTSDRRREMLFNILLHNPSLGKSSLSGQKVLNVFAGTGAVGLEAYSRGAETVLFIENNKRALPALYDNINKFSLPTSCVWAKDVMSIGKAPYPFDLIFLDPPYSRGLAPKALGRLFDKGWLAPDAFVIVETAKQEALGLPPFLDLCFMRYDGIAALHFCKRVVSQEEI